MNIDNEDSVSFDEGDKPAYTDLYKLFIESGLLIKNSAATPETPLLASLSSLARKWLMQAN
jgi:hypothetical protein